MIEYVIGSILTKQKVPFALGLIVLGPEMVGQPIKIQNPCLDHLESPGSSKLIKTHPLLD